MAKDKNDETVLKIFLVLLGIAAIILTVSILTAIVNIGSDIVTSWLLIALQISITVIGVLGSLWIITEIANSIFKKLNYRINLFDRKYSDEIKTLKRRTPIFIVSVLLISDAAMILADKNFGGDALPTIIISFNLLILFWLAYHLVIKKRKILKALGVILFYLALIFLPVSSLLYHQWTINDLIKYILSLEYSTITMLTLSMLLIFLIPFIFYSNIKEAHG